MNAYQLGVKLAWLGTYYHGTSPKAEKQIMRQGLRASKGAGRGGASKVLWPLIGAHIPPPFGLDMAGGLPKGKISLSRSKGLAKLYGLALSPKTSNLLADIARVGRYPGERAELGQRVRALLRHAVDYQPLQVSGLKGHTLTRDPGHRVLGVQATKDIPAARISKAAPGRLARLLSRVLR